MGSAAHSLAQSSLSMRVGEVSRNSTFASRDSFSSLRKPVQSRAPSALMLMPLPCVILDCFGGPVKASRPLLLGDQASERISAKRVRCDSIGRSPLRMSQILMRPVSLPAATHSPFEHGSHSTTLSPPGPRAASWPGRSDRDAGSAMSLVSAGLRMSEMRRCPLLNALASKSGPDQLIEET